MKDHTKHTLAQKNMNIVMIYTRKESVLMVCISWPIPLKNNLTMKITESTHSF